MSKSNKITEPHIQIYTANEIHKILAADMTKKLGLTGELNAKVVFQQIPIPGGEVMVAAVTVFPHLTPKVSKTTAPISSPTIESK